MSDLELYGGMFYNRWSGGRRRLRPEKPRAPGTLSLCSFLSALSYASSPRMYVSCEPLDRVLLSSSCVANVALLSCVNCLLLTVARPLPRGVACPPPVGRGGARVIGSRGGRTAHHFLPHASLVGVHGSPPPERDPCFACCFFLPGSPSPRALSWARFHRCLATVVFV